MEAVCYCIAEGINPEEKNVNDKYRNAFFYACEQNHIEML